jgi:hypothetical protein
MKNIIRHKKRQAGGIALVKQRGPDYMARIGRSGSLKRKVYRGGRPRTPKMHNVRNSS